eukprot:GCRY01000569.1.p2 GENE.GCRY01000569.1~~GCRY01000569.1.p2  ORF type:complete len:156 (-),score=19.38 GCRY01000569.1:693-1160(-)
MSKRKARERKNVTATVLDEFPVPDYAKKQFIARIIAPRGNSVFDFVGYNEKGEELKGFAKMPNKFRNLVFVKRGDFLIISLINVEGETDFEISHVLLKDQLKYLKKTEYWPEQFTEQPELATAGSEESGSDDDLFENPNRTAPSSESETESSSEE